MKCYDMKCYDMKHDLGDLVRSLITERFPDDSRRRLPVHAWRVERRLHPERALWHIPTVDRLSPEALAVAYRLVRLNPDPLLNRARCKGFMADLRDSKSRHTSPRYHGINRLARVDSYADAYHR